MTKRLANLVKENAPPQGLAVRSSINRLSLKRSSNSKPENEEINNVKEGELSVRSSRFVPSKWSKSRMNIKYHKSVNQIENFR